MGSPLLAIGPREIGPHLANDDVLTALERIADLLEVQHAEPFRVRAYRNAADTIRDLDRPVAQILHDEGLAGLEALPAIGTSIAATIRELLVNKRLTMLDRLEGQVSPEDLLASVPGIGEKLAHRIHETLGIETLEALELAAHDRTLEQVPGIGRGKAGALRDIVGSILSRSTRRHARHPSIRGHDAATDAVARPPGVAEILSVDEEYRRKAAEDTLRKISPRRFNPYDKAWLPILHTERGQRRYTALFSNTRRAHELAKTDDWVVLVYEIDGHENQCTVVTEHRGKLAGRRVVRGRERACRDYYESHRVSSE
jgi:DNA polymerase (family 10)